MFQKTFSFTGTLLLAGAMVLMLPGLSPAQYIGGHGGAGRFGGGHFGAYHGGYRYGYPHDSAYRHNGYYSHYPSYGYDAGYGYPNYYSAYSGSDYDLSYSNSSGAVDRYPYDNPRLQPDLRDPGPYALDNTVAPPDTNAHITVTVPVNGKVWFDGSETTSTGTIREFRSPPLTSGRQYSYGVQARWNENGRDVTQTQQVNVTAGAHVSVNFPIAPNNGR
jgi:uncharacterized protein (TIGR03000 family)